MRETSCSPVTTATSWGNACGIVSLTLPSAEAFYLGLVSQIAEPDAVAMQGVEAPSMLSLSDRWPPLDDFTERMMYLDLVSYLPDDILVKVDRAAMAVSLETRVPLLDHRV